ncbi:MAG: 23S rRNA (pseudouridine(1915)-N(3))-methyltransferase RlmH [Bacteroidales bacterium]|nr:23S rRNA (pseudouridine(1915)-N(3))-methyltransferase RlmH [Bacteroidales bacterium]
MQIELLHIGNTHKGFIEEGINEYFNRLKHYVKFEMTYIQALKNTQKLNIEQQKKKEEELLLKSIDGKSAIILLDENGKEYSSPNFAKFIQNKMNQGQNITFIIGGPYGFTEELKTKYPKIALSKMTFSHQMVRLFFVEQIYRALTILKGENYHH